MYYCDSNNDHSSRQLYRINIHMTRRKQPLDPIDYVRVRIDQLTTERSKNDNEVSHMVLDKAIAELSIVLDLLERKAPL